MIQLCRKGCPNRRPGCQDGCPLLAAQLRHNQAEQRHLKEHIAQLADSVRGCLEQMPASKLNCHRYKKADHTRNRRT